jgi:3D (Asp-Asp-Asp) domain-containing protein
MPLTLQADGNAMSVRTQAHTVGEALAQAGIPLVGQDYCRPPADSPVAPHMTIQVIRVRQAIKIEQEPIPVETNWQPAAELPIDTRRVVQPSQAGLIKRRYRITWEDGQEVSNVLEDEWIDRPPVAQVVTYGTRIAVQTAETPDGPIRYWRRFRVLATSYSPASAGKDQEHPRFGMTRSGAKAGFGVIAVDPKVIPLNSPVYVPGYGKAVAGDTGAGILGRHIDLGYDDAAPPHWYQWVDIYLLAPPPPDRQIRYVLPDWPRE